MQCFENLCPKNNTFIKRIAAKSSNKLKSDKYRIEHSHETL